MPTNLASNALISEDDFLTACGIPVTDDQVNRDQLRFHINVASQVIQDYLDREIISPAAAATEIFSGHDAKEYTTNNRRINALTSLEYWDGSDWTTMTEANYPRTFDVASGRVWFTKGHVFWAGQDNFRITYTYGWVQDAVPAPLKLICIQMLQRNILRAEGKEGVKTVTFRDVSTTYALGALPDETRAVLSPYRRRGFGR